MDEKRDRNSGLRRMKIFLGLMALAFVVTLAVIVGNRLSDEALAVLAGAVCGVGAAIPTSLIIVSISRRQHNEPQPVQPPAHQQGPYPPVVVVTPQGGQQPYTWNGPPPSLAAPTQRQFRVVGGTTMVPTEVRSYERYI